MGGIEETQSETHGQKKIRNLSRMLFSAMEALASHNLLEDPTIHGDARSWYRGEQAARDCRAAQHRERNRLERVRQKALARLTDEEKLVLGIDNPDKIV